VEKDSRLQNLSYITFRVLRKGSPLPGSLHRAPIERNAPFPVPTFNYLSEFPVNGPLTPCVPMGPLWREVPVSTPFFYT